MRGDYPAFTLMIVNKDNRKDKTIAGAAWRNEYGGFSLRLNPGIVIKWDDEVYLNLNPRMTKAEYAKMRREQDEPPTAGAADDYDFVDDMSEEENGAEEELGEETRGD